MKLDMLQDVIDFHRKFGLESECPQPLTSEPGSLGRFRAKFGTEEAREFELAVAALTHAIDDQDRAMARLAVAEQLDALIDQVYVVLGTAVSAGLVDEFIAGWPIVHAANMSKVRAMHPSDSKRGSAFDVIKPAGWQKPNLEPLVPSSLLDMIIEVDKNDDGA